MFGKDFSSSPGLSCLYFTAKRLQHCCSTAAVMLLRHCSDAAKRGGSCSQYGDRGGVIGGRGGKIKWDVDEDQSVINCSLPQNLFYFFQLLQLPAISFSFLSGSFETNLFIVSRQDKGRIVIRQYSFQFPRTNF